MQFNDDQESQSVAAKRCYISHGDTPRKTRTKTRRLARAEQCSSSSRTLFKSPARSPKFPSRNIHLTPIKKSPVKHHKWTFEEDKALIEFISIAKTDPKYGHSASSAHQWPGFKQNNSFWSDGAKHIKCSTSSNILLTNSRLRSRVNMYRKSFATLEDAEIHYKLTLSDSLAELVIDRRKSNLISQTEPVTRDSGVDMASTSSLANDLLPSVDSALNLLHHLNLDDLKTLTNKLFLQLALAHNITSNPANFCSLSLQAMVLLKENNKSNLLYKYALALCSTNPVTKEPIFPMDRMPFGLVEYQIEFFSCTHISQIKMPVDFAQWHETLCAEFPTRFNRLFRGPMWSGVDKQLYGSPLTAKVNVACIGTRTVEKNTAASQFTTEPVIQVQALKDMKAAYPLGRFWIKGDGCDVKSALQESVSGVWNGDVDLGDGKLQVLRAEYEDRKKGLSDLEVVSTKDGLQGVFQQIISDLDQDKQFLSQGLVKAQNVYEQKFNSPNTSKKVLMELCWERVEFNELLQQSQFFESYVKSLVTFLSQVSEVLQVHKSIREKKSDWQNYLRNLFIKKRQPAATHVFVMLISDEQRNKKPYCMPVQYLPYHSLKDQTVRELTQNLRRQMADLGMAAIGFVSDGEFNSLRTKGENRPLHLVQLIRDARESVTRKSESSLLNLLIKVGDDADGKPMTKKVDPAIPSDVINLLHNLTHGAEMSLFEAVKCIRRSLVPDGYDAYPFRVATEECLADMLRSLVGTYRFRNRVMEYMSKGIDFSTYLYIPEVDNETGEAFHEREDHCHILKRIWKHTREEGPPGTDLQGFDNAMQDPSTGLTHAALTGERKQSVTDAERMLSYHVAKFLCENGYEKEGKFVRAVAGWHEAADGRGLSEIQRCKKNYEMLNMILDDWMPWHNTTPSFATIDINRPIKGICGFSRETLIAITTNIESIEYRRRESGRIGYPEHPRAGTSDDVEAFISLLHRFLGNIFTMKDMKSLWRKSVREYCKRIDRELPFYYWTNNERFREFTETLPAFNQPEYVPDDIDIQHHPLRLHKLTLNRREDSSIFVAGRCFLPARNQVTVRHRIHKPVLEPPAPNAMDQQLEEEEEEEELLH